MGSDSIIHTYRFSKSYHLINEVTYSITFITMDIACALYGLKTVAIVSDTLATVIKRTTTSFDHAVSPPINKSDQRSEPSRRCYYRYDGYWLVFNSTLTMCRIWYKHCKTTLMSFSLCYYRSRSLFKWVHCSSRTHFAKGLWVHNWNLGENRGGGVILSLPIESNHIILCGATAQLSHIQNCDLIRYFSRKNNTQFYEILIGIL